MLVEVGIEVLHESVMYRGILYLPTGKLLVSKVKFRYLYHGDEELELRDIERVFPDPANFIMDLVNRDNSGDYSEFHETNGIQCPVLREDFEVLTID